MLIAGARAPNSSFAVHVSNFACLCVSVVIVTESHVDFLAHGCKTSLACMFSFPPSCFSSHLSQEFKAELKSLMEFTVFMFGTVRQ